MPARVLIGGAGSRNAAAVDRDGSIRVANWWVNPNDLSSEQVAQRKSFSSQLTDSAGSESLAVDGSTTAVRFSVEAAQDRIIWVHEVRLIIHSTQANITNVEARRFGAAASSPGLTNGFQLIACQRNVETELFLAPVTTIGGFERYAASTGRGIVNNLDAIAAGTDFLMVTVPMIAPIGLFPGSGDLIYIDIQDDLTALALFEVDVFGVQEIVK